MLTIELQYFPCIRYFSIFLSQDGPVALEQHEYFVKQTYRNRCKILTANGVDVLSVPVLAGNSKTLIRDIRIDYNQKWINRHWRAIQSAYGKAPFFEYYADGFRDILLSKQTFLFDLNLSLLTLCLENLQIEKTLMFTDEYIKYFDNPADELRSVIHPKKNTFTRINYVPVAYSQVFGSKFVNDLSILDLLFCEGPSAYQIIKSGINS